MLQIDFGRKPNIDEIVAEATEYFSAEEAHIFIDCFNFYYNQKPEYLQVTSSGSTGPPKSFNFSRQAVVTSIENTALSLGLNSGDTALLALPLKYVAGRLMLLRAMHLQWNLFCVKPSLTLSDIPRVKFAALTPAQLINNRIALKHIQVLLLGGAPVSDRLLDLIAKESSFDIYQSFGATETLTNFAIRRLAPKFQEHYITLPTVKIRTDDQSRLWVYYPGITDQYVCTGDVVEILDENSFKWIGRSDFVINTGGVKVYPDRLENLLADVLPERHFVITSIPDEIFGQRIVLVVESSDQDSPEEISNGIERLAIDKKLNRHLLPRKIVFLNRFPLTHTGKPDRKKIQQLVLTSNVKT